MRKLFILVAALICFTSTASAQIAAKTKWQCAGVAQTPTPGTVNAVGFGGCTLAGKVLTLTPPAGGTNYQTIMNGASVLTQRAILHADGTTVVATDDNVNHWTNLSAVVSSAASPLWSPVLYANSPDVSSMLGGTNAGSYTIGTRFYPLKDKSCVGVRFFWWPATVRTIRVSLWKYDGTRLEYIDAVTSGIPNGQTLSVTWVTPHALTAGHVYVVTIWDTSGTDISKFEAAAFNDVPMPAYSGDIVWSHWNLYVLGGDIYPPAGYASSERYPVEPLFAP